MKSISLKQQSQKKLFVSGDDPRDQTPKDDFAQGRASETYYTATKNIKQ